MTASEGVAAPAVDRRRLLGKRAQLLAGASVSYNLIEAAVSIAAGAVAGSVALVGFGLDSLVEVSSGVVILWQFRHRMPETRERQALRLIALSFFALAAYVTVESVRNLLGAGEAAPSGGNRDRDCLAGRHAVPVLGAASDWTRTWLRQRRRRLQADPLVHLPLGGPAGRACAERHLGLGLGRPVGRSGHCRCRRP